MNEINTIYVNNINIIKYIISYLSIPTIIITLIILCIPTLYQAFILNFLNPFVIIKGPNKGKKVPEFMSTHPSAKNRIKNINEWMNKVILDYPPVEI